MRNILKGYRCAENIIREYLSLLSLYQYISKRLEICSCNDNIPQSVSFIEHCSQYIEHPRLHGQYIAGRIILSIILNVYSGLRKKLCEVIEIIVETTYQPRNDGDKEKSYLIESWMDPVKKKRLIFSVSI